MRSIAVLLVFAAGAVAQTPGPARRPDRLQAENRTDPIGMDVPAPRLSWRLNWPQSQVAYQVRAATSSALLDAPDLWDSGRTESRVSGVVYGGRPLRSRERVVWQVRVWSGIVFGAPSEWSAPAVFEAGLLKRSDWAAQWIAHPGWTFGQPMPVFATGFNACPGFQSARLYIAGLGMYAASINGRPVTEDVLLPGNTLYTRQVEYGAYDVTALLREQGNTLGVELGNGIYNSVVTPDRYYALVSPAPLPVKLIAQLEIACPGPSRQTVASDASWRTTLGGLTVSTWFGGEDFDARREPAGWKLPGADHSGWDRAAISAPPAPETVLAWRPAPPVRVVDEIAPVAVAEPQPGVYVFDMGVNFAGWQRLRVSGPTGTRVTMRIGELLDASGLVRQDTAGGNIYDTYTLAGTGEETWHPAFSYHGFRYLQVTGLPAPPDRGTIAGLVLRAANDPAGSFASSNALLNDIHRIIDRAIQGNMMSIFTDCPDREKLGWLGDWIGVFGSIARNYDVAAYLRTAMRNMAESQTGAGMVPTFAPAYADYSIYGEGFRDDVNWGSAMILAPWFLYETYGDERTMASYYPEMQRYMAYLAGRASGYLLDYGLGDWISPEKTLPTEVIATYGFYRCAETMSRVAAVLGRAGDAERYAALARNIAAAFNAKYLNREGGYYAAGQQAADAVALDMGIVPEDVRGRVVEHLVAGIRAEGNHVLAGIVSLQAVLRALSAAGRDDVIFDIATQTTNPSYGYQVAHGATSLTEEWNGPTAGGSQNHLMLGAIDEWFTAGLAGIRQAVGSTGYTDLVIKPAVVGDLTHVKGSYLTPQGVVESEWAVPPEGGLLLVVTVPANSRAAILVPAPGGGAVIASAGAEFDAREGDYARYRTGPGRFEFRVSR